MIYYVLRYGFILKKSCLLKCISKHDFFVTYFFYKICDDFYYILNLWLNI